MGSANSTPPPSGTTEIGAGKPTFLEKQQEDFYYGVGIIIWLAIAVILGLINEDVILFIIVLIPVGVFVSYILNKNCIYSATFPRVSSEFLYVILAIFLAWVLVAKSEKEKIIRILLASLFIYILSLIDVKICNKLLFDATVIIPETMAISLILAAIYLYFKDSYTGLAKPHITVI